MLGFFLNPSMLIGLAGLALPVIAHLISRKRYDLVEWGAMQFLELDPSAKRKIRLEEILLLLVRMGLIALLAVAMARPWFAGHWLTGYVSTQPRDVVLVIDGSYSMNWEGKAMTPHVQAVQLARQFLSDLRPGDSIQMIDARESPHLMLPEATREVYLAKQTLNDLPAPTGTADLAAAVYRAVQLLSVGSNLHREVVVFTDLQAYGWKADEQIAWAKVDDVRNQSKIFPRIWIVDTSQSELGRGSNFAIERLKASRQLAVAGVPVKIASSVKYTGGDAPISRKVYLEIDQQRQGDQTVQLKLPPQGETAVEFEYRFDMPGSHLVSAVLDSDALPGDNRADVVVTVMESLPALLVDGDLQLDPTRRETFFANAALKSAGNDRPWIKATTITPEEVTADRLKSMSIAIIANVESLSEPTVNLLKQFVTSGHGLLFTLGDRVTKERYHEMLTKAGDEFFPCHLESIVSEDEREKRGVRVASNRLELPWLRPFRSDQGGTLSDARWSRWWKLVVTNDLDRRRDLPAEAQPGVGDFNRENANQFPNALPKNGAAVVDVRLTNGDPLLVSHRYGRGMVAVFASSLDADWNTLPAKQDYVPFLHELLFSLVTQSASRNVDVGQSLSMAVPSGMNVEEYQFLNPFNKAMPAERIDDALQPIVRLRSAPIPGVYRFARKLPKLNEIARPEYFAVNFDRSESDLTQLTDAQKKALAGDGRMQFVSNLPELRENMFDESTRSEFWWLLIYAFLGSLVVETWMTRRMVRGALAE